MWKRVNIEKIKVPSYKEYTLAVVKDSSQDTVKIKKIKDLHHLPIETLISANKTFGIDDKFVNMVKTLYNTGFYIKTFQNTSVEKPIVVDYITDEQNDTLIDYNIVEIEANSSATVVFDYNSGAHGFHNGITEVIAKEGATVNIVKIQRLGNEFNDFDNNLVIVGKDATVNWSNVVIGAKMSTFDVTVYLDEIGATFISKSIFLGVDSQKYDMAYKVYHQAPKSTSSVDLKGALKGSAEATFIGNIDIKKGAKKAKAEENETVLLLDKTVKSVAIPALYCGEDDVVAKHSASAGQIDEDKLYYVMSRGFSFEEARLLMVQAILNPVIDLIPYDPVKEIIIRGHIGRKIIK
ncbi:Fe-S cluster assembly protein SufD [Thermoanaerobacter sp. CM-CNRG TB177]|jgi:FeS assembly protein SufD|uniref:SufBD protein n=2 Tax=Thermoanaerobacter TaxID=1754 RepID=D3T6A7_THEIA|nr:MULTISPECIES: Fe-S cluster assembly protein SufD [Thermoanaerobacter]ADD03501.1 SufBD protein [Thermoanaerobacter italicus Ab9]MBT1279699.1 Fe-S cluster assembly protein SufD [Thermoanaerobacter sp. CM-CNRG TB177]MDP9750244.1 FeS assembly protein SufD [Thermoanaerobacter pentosaceus]